MCSFIVLSPVLSSCLSPFLSSYFYFKPICTLKAKTHKTTITFSPMGSMSFLIFELPYNPIWYFTRLPFIMLHEKILLCRGFLSTPLLKYLVTPIASFFQQLLHLLSALNLEPYLVFTWKHANVCHSSTFANMLYLICYCFLLIHFNIYFL